MKYDFSKVVVKDIDGNDALETDLVKVMANAIYQNTNEVGMADKAMAINRGEEVDLSEPEINELKRCIASKEYGLRGLGQKYVIEYIESVVPETKE